MKEVGGLIFAFGIFAWLFGMLYYLIYYRGFKPMIDRRRLAKRRRGAAVPPKVALSICSDEPAPESKSDLAGTIEARMTHSQLMGNRKAIEVPSKSRLEFQKDTKGKYAYRCPACHSATAVLLILPDPGSPVESPLSNDVRAAFDALTRPRTLYYEDSLVDRVCSECGAPSRIVFETYEHHIACEVTRVEQVLELADAAPDH
jgi:hypothetical protein